MHFVNNEDKTRQAILRFMVYGVMGVIVFGLSFLLVLAVRGYDIDRNTGEIISNGLLVVTTEPDNATISINGVAEEAKTPDELPLPGGQYEIRISRDGYNDWVNVIDLESFSVHRLEYPQLIPKSIETLSFSALENISFSVVDDSKTRMVVGVSSVASPSITVFDPRSNDANGAVISLRSVLTTDSDGSYGQLEFASWRRDGAALYITHTTKDGSELVLIDLANQDNSLNVTSTLDDPILSPIVSEDRNEFYELNQNGQLLLHTYSPLTVSTLSEDVSKAFVSSENELYFVDAATKQLQRSIDSGESFVTILENVGDSTHLTGSRFEEQDYVAISRSATQISLYRSMRDISLGINTPEKILTFSSPIEQVEFSEQGRFVLARSDAEAVVFDLEDNTEHRFAIEPTASLSWADEFKLFSIDYGVVRLIDFDGTNGHQITQTEDGYYPFMDARSEFVFTVSRNSANNQLFVQRSDIIVSQ